MKSRVLNAWSAKETRSDGTEVSVVSLESTTLPSSVSVQGPFPAPRGDHLTKVVLAGVGLTMAEDEILAADGLLRNFRISHGPDENSVLIEILSEFRTSASASLTAGLPAKIDIAVSRKPLNDLMSGKRIAVDPGHGGKDHGIEGPVNLLEKDCALDVSKSLEHLLRNAGAIPLMTRNDDSYLAAGFRLAKVSDLSPEVAVEVHMSGEKNPMARSYHVLAKRGCGSSVALASSIAEALTERMGIVFGGIEQMETERQWDFPLVRIEPVCLTYFADEANFRAPLYRRRVAQAIFNGVARHIRSTQGKGGG